MERLFTIIQRINSLLLLAVLLGAAGAIIFVTSESTRWQRRGAVEVAESGSGDKKPIIVSFHRVEGITGSDTQMMRLTTNEKTTKFSSGGYGKETRNILFLSGDEKTARWLFNDHKNLLFAVSQLREESSNKEDTTTKALYFEYISNDTDEDGNLSSADHSNVALTKADGTGFTTTLANTNKVFLYEMVDPKHLSIVFQKDGKVRHLKIAISDFSVVSDQEIIDVPKTI
jgi:hypothetical protein